MAKARFTVCVTLLLILVAGAVHKAARRLVDTHIVLSLACGGRLALSLGKICISADRCQLVSAQLPHKLPQEFHVTSCKSYTPSALRTSSKYQVPCVPAASSPTIFRAGTQHPLTLGLSAPQAQAAACWDVRTPPFGLHRRTPLQQPHKTCLLSACCICPCDRNYPHFLLRSTWLASMLPATRCSSSAHVGRHSHRG